jgi:hypothetical protein
VTLVRVLLAASIVAAWGYLVGLTLAVVVRALREGGRRATRPDDEDALSESRFAMPVTVLVRITGDDRGTPGEPARINTAIASVLGLDYPAFDVIVLAEEPRASDWAALKSEWALEPREFFYRQSLPTEPVRMIYKSARDARLMVVDKAPGTPGEAWNCGVNFARSRFVTIVDPRIDFEPDALLHAMATPTRDPGGIVAATSHVETIPSERQRTGGIGVRLLATFQYMASLRSQMESRLLWRNCLGGFGPHDGVVVWRRDALVAAGGFSTAAADPDLEMLGRLQIGATQSDASAPAGGSRAVRTAEVFGRRDALSFGDWVRAAATRQLAALQALPAITSIRGRARRAVAYFVASEIVTPFASAWVVGATTVSALAGWVSWRDAALALLFVSFSRASLDAVALLLREATPHRSSRDGLGRLLLSSPLGIVASGAAACARASGVRTAVAAWRADRRMRLS